MRKNTIIFAAAGGMLFIIANGWSEPIDLVRDEVKKQGEFHQGFDQAKQNQIIQQNNLQEEKKVVGGNPVILSENPPMKVEFIVYSDDTAEWQEYINGQLVGSYQSAGFGNWELEEGTVLPVYGNYQYTPADLKPSSIMQRFDSTGNLLWTERSFFYVSPHNDWERMVQIIDSKGETIGWNLVRNSYFTETPGILASFASPNVEGPSLAGKEVVLFDGNGIQTGWQAQYYEYEVWELVGVRTLQWDKDFTRHPADLTLDGTVDMTDLVFALQHLGERVLNDTNTDFVLDLYDVQEVLEHFGEEVPLEYFHP